VEFALPKRPGWKRFHNYGKRQGHCIVERGGRDFTVGRDVLALDISAHPFSVLGRFDHPRKSGPKCIAFPELQREMIEGLCSSTVWADKVCSVEAQRARDFALEFGREPGGIDMDVKQ
jgi:hypothetical protein